MNALHLYVHNRGSLLVNFNYNSLPSGVSFRAEIYGESILEIAGELSSRS